SRKFTSHRPRASSTRKRKNPGSNLLNFTFRRILYALPSLFGVITLSFFLIHLVPGDPVDFVLGENADARDRQALRHELGLDVPLPNQYSAYLGNLTHLNLGRSTHTR